MADITRTPVQINYNYGSVWTPYQRTGQRWDRPIGIWRERTSKLRTACLLLLGVNLILGILFVMLLAEPKQQVFVAQVQSDGYIEKVGYLAQPPKVLQTVTALFLTQYVNSLMGDQQFAKNYTLNPKDWALIQQHIDPLLKKQAKVEINSMQALAAGQYQIMISLQTSGAKPVIQRYALSIGFEHLDHHSDIKLHDNPLALYVNALGLKEVGNESHGQSGK